MAPRQHERCCARRADGSDAVVYEPARNERTLFGARQASQGEVEC